jgi:hypothetical protein
MEPKVRSVLVGVGILATHRENCKKKNLLYVVPMISCCNIVLLKYRLFSYMCLINIHSETFFLVIKFRWYNTTKANL